MAVAREKREHLDGLGERNQAKERKREAEGKKERE